MDPLFDALGPTRSVTTLQIVLSLSLSFVLGLFVAQIYRWTHQSFSYARSFLHTMVLATVIITIMIISIGNNMARGLGILGAMAFVRFRTPIRDPRDIIFLFATLAIGIASGSQTYGVAILGTIFFALTAIFLAWSPFASRRQFEGLLRFMLPQGSRSDGELQQIFSRYTTNTEMIAMRGSHSGRGQ